MSDSANTVDLGNEILDLVRIPSVTGREGDLADALERRLTEGPSANRHRCLRIGDTILLSPLSRVARSRPLVVLAGHLDTVPRADAPEPGLIDGRVVGRGAVDMKAGLAVMMVLAETLPAQAGFCDRAYLFYTGEEGPAVGNALGPILDREPWLREAGLAILLEPTSGTLELGCNGSVHLEVALQGTACHSARPWKGEHPLRRALPWLQQLFEMPERQVEIAGAVFREVVTPTIVSGGDVRNVVPGEVRVNLNLRYAPDRTPEEAEDYARTLIPASLRARVSLVDHAVAGSVDLDAPLLRHLVDSTGLPRRAKQGWTDVARFTSVGVPAVNWGPGDPELSHTGSEFVEVDEARRVLHEMRRFLEGPGPAGSPGRKPPRG